MRTLSIAGILLVFLTGSASSQTEERASEGNSYLSVNSNTPGFLVFLNDSLVGETPLDSIILSPGSYELRVAVKGADIWAARDWVKHVKLEKGESLVVKASPKKYAIVNSIPFGAKVLIEGHEVGSTPYMAKESAVGIELVLSGYLPHRIEADELMVKDIITVNLLPEDPTAGDFSPIVAEKVLGRSEIMVRRTSIGITALSGVVAVYYKFKADKEYGKYLDAVNPVDIRKHYDRTQYYDNIAGVSFGTFQAGFLFSIYWFLRD